MLLNYVQQLASEETGASCRVLRAALNKCKAHQQELKRIEDRMTGGGRSHKKPIATMFREHEYKTESTHSCLLKVERDVQSILEHTNSAISAVEAIARLSGAIEELTQHSRVVAINAMIEACRMTDHTRSFAVIAQELRMLNETVCGTLNLVQQVAQEIEGQLPGLQAKVKDLLQVLDQTTTNFDLQKQRHSLSRDQAFQRLQIVLQDQDKHLNKLSQCLDTALRKLQCKDKICQYVDQAKVHLKANNTSGHKSAAGALRQLRSLSENEIIQTINCLSEACEAASDHQKGLDNYIEGLNGEPQDETPSLFQVLDEQHEHTQEMVQNLDNLEGRLNDQSRNIEDMINAIDSISRLSDTIEMLTRRSQIVSISSMIEAGRLGKEARGFTVIAQNLRNLNQTIQDTLSLILDMAQHIQRLLPKLQKETEKAQQNILVAHCVFDESDEYSQEIRKNILEVSEVIENECRTKVDEVCRDILSGLSYLQFQDRMQQITIGLERHIHGDEEGLFDANRASDYILEGLDEEYNNHKNSQTWNSDTAPGLVDQEIQFF